MEIFSNRNDVRAEVVTDGSRLRKLDGLLITGWQESHYLPCLRLMQRELCPCKEQLSVLGIAHGAAALGHNGFLKVMDFHAKVKSNGQVTGAVLNLPCYDHTRFMACFVPEVTFIEIAPNLGVLCEDRKRGPIILRQGNHLSCSYVAELTKQQFIYDYWLEMVEAMKNG